MKYQDEKFYWTYQCGVHWPDDYIGPDSMTWWILEASYGFTDVGLYRISESIRAYAYLIVTRAADVTKLRPPARLRQTNWRVLHIPVLSECKNGVFKQYFLETFNDFN